MKNKLIMIFLIPLFIGCSAKIYDKRFNNILKRYEIKPTINQNNWVALRTENHKIVTDSTTNDSIIKNSKNFNSQVSIEKEFLIERKISRKKPKLAKYLYYDAVKLYKTNRFEESKIKFILAIENDSLLIYKSDILLWISQANYRMNLIDSSQKYFQLYTEFSESNIFPEFNHDITEDESNAQALKLNSASKDSVLSSPNYHTNIFEEPSYKYHPNYIGSNFRKSSKPSILLGIMYSRQDELNFILGLRSKPIDLYTPNLIFMYGDIYKRITLGTYIKHLEGKYNKYSSQFYVDITYSRRSFTNIYYDFWQPMVGYEFNYFPIEWIGTHFATYNYLYNQWNKNEQIKNGWYYKQWNSNRILLGFSFFIYDDINITGRLNNLNPEVLIDFEPIQIGYSKYGIFVNMFNMKF